MLTGSNTCTQGVARRLSLANRYLKSSEVWRVFYCLFRACVALAYPGRWDQGMDPTTQVVPTQEEFIPLSGGRPVSTENGLVDFDINDRNVMVGEDRSTLVAGDHPHDQTPIFKIGDLGDVQAWRTPEYRRSVKAHAMARVSGNPTVRYISCGLITICFANKGFKV